MPFLSDEIVGSCPCPSCSSQDSEKAWLTKELKSELSEIMKTSYQKDFTEKYLTEFADNYIKSIDMLDKANLKFELRPVRILDQKRK